VSVGALRTPASYQIRRSIVRRGPVRRAPRDSRSGYSPPDPVRIQRNRPLKSRVRALEHLLAATCQSSSHSNNAAPMLPTPARKLGSGLRPRVPAQRSHPCSAQDHGAGQGHGGKGRTPPDSSDATPCSMAPPATPSAGNSPCCTCVLNWFCREIKSFTGAVDARLPQQPVRGHVDRFQRHG
jgi:hypothetical protein